MDENELKAKKGALEKALDWLGLSKTAKDIKHECSECKEKGSECDKCRAKRELEEQTKGY